MNDWCRCVFFMIAACVCTFSCGSRFAPAVSMPATPVLTEGCLYAVVTNQYVPVRDIPYTNGVTVRYLRSGDIEKVIGRESVLSDTKKIRTMWLKLTDGWIPLADAHVFDREMQAKTAAENAKK